MARPVRLDPAEQAALAAATSPIDRAVLLTQIANRRGTLCPDLAEMRARDLAAEMAEGRKAVWLAHKIGRSAALVTKITRRYRAQQAA